MVSVEGRAAVLGVTVGTIGVGSDGRTCARHREERFADKAAALAAASRVMAGSGCVSFYLRDERTGEEFGDVTVKTAALV